MRIFVAGATGVIGRRLVPLLVAQGHEVTALSRRPAPGVVTGDVYDARRLREVVAAARPDVVIHQLTDLAVRDSAANGRIRRVGTRNLVDASLAAGVRRVISQSIAFAYEPGSEPAVETTPLDVDAPDARRRDTAGAVAALESMTAEAPEWVMLRYGLLYGPDTWYTKSGSMAAAPVAAGPDVASFLHVDDAALACVQALDWPNGAVNIVDDEPAPASEWAPVFAESVGVPVSPATDAPRTPWARGASNAYARTRLSWSPTHPTWRTGFLA